VPLDAACLDTLLATKQDVFPRLLGGHGLFPGAVACIDRVAAEVPIAIASGALRHEIELLLDRGGLAGRVPIIVAAGETPRSKPAPDPYARAFDLLVADGHLPPTTTPGQVVAIEDSEWGLQSARAAGLRTVGVTTSYPPDRLPSAEVTVQDIDAVTMSVLRSLVSDQPSQAIPPA
jgi:beta-phosphoglucomutase-like phosphatase (HAD superfamily)